MQGDDNDANTGDMLAETGSTVIMGNSDIDDNGNTKTGGGDIIQDNDGPVLKATSTPAVAVPAVATATVADPDRHGGGDGGGATGGGGGVVIADDDTNAGGGDEDVAPRRAAHLRSLVGQPRRQLEDSHSVYNSVRRLVTPGDNLGRQLG